ncbi:DMT family transporter [Alisedimentitalea sp. MJ-SS2]|uniref:DMT family transporter n=1 Tax=Aliisedimentitalea sp. MJ-SS2 TaxID=3049795 RepID=UPI002913ACE0|nr:DMT family transporter [Alisedimentitalea sp. MJ-SS2]MDU8929180.1 DMT family transporter [Alisedimentitalea sp. MJ-SS2]
MTTQSPSQITGFAAAWSIVFVWSGWLVVSRLAADSSLTIYDLAAMRYGLAALIGVPLSLYYKPWRDLTLTRIAVISFILGPVYILSVFSAFHYAPAAHGGIFMNGILPLISILFGIFLFRTRPGPRQVLGAALILVSTVVLASDSFAAGHAHAWIGDLLFIVGALFFSTYVILSERWSLGAMQVIFCGTVVNALLYLPVWALWLPSGLADASWQPLLLQGIYQGFIPNLVGLIFIAHASRNIGNANTSIILAAVPGTGGLLGVVILGETLSPLSMLAIALLTIGLLISVRRKKKDG